MGAYTGSRPPSHVVLTEFLGGKANHWCGRGLFLAHQIALWHTSAKAGTASRSSFKDVATKLVCITPWLLVLVDEFSYLFII